MTIPSTDVVLVRAYVSYEAMLRRGGGFAQDRLTRRLLHEPMVEHFVIGEPYRSAASVARDKARRRPPAALPPVAGRSRYRPVRWRREDPVAIEDVRRSVETYDRGLARHVHHQGFRAPHVITTHPLVAGFSPLEWAASVTFFATDDWTAYGARRPWWPAYRSAMEAFVASNRKLAAVSQPLLDRLPTAAASALVPNGVEPAEWEEPRACPEWFEDLKAPRALYVGTLDDRLDLEAIETLARQMPSLSIVLVGPQPTPGILDGLRGLANVVLRASVPREQVLALVPQAEVCLVPHIASQLTTAMSPLKLYEYLAAGRPVVASDLPPMRAVHHSVKLVGSPQGWAPAVGEALAGGPMAPEERQRFLRDNDWATRQTTLLHLAVG